VSPEEMPCTPPPRSSPAIRRPQGDRPHGARVALKHLGVAVSDCNSVYPSRNYYTGTHSHTHTQIHIQIHIHIWNRTCSRPGFAGRRGQALRSHLHRSSGDARWAMLGGLVPVRRGRITMLFGGHVIGTNTRCCACRNRDEQKDGETTKPPCSRPKNN